VEGASPVQPWTFGVEPLPQTLVLAGLLRRVAGLATALEAEHPAVEQLTRDLQRAERELDAAVPRDPAPRVGQGAGLDRRVYLDHARDVGAYNPGFPEYAITVTGERATGTVSFPLAFEGPPGIVHGGVLATFFDCVIQHHNCDVGVAGKTTSLFLEFRRPTPLLTVLDFEIDRLAEDRRITSEARLLAGGEVLCQAVVRAVAGDRSKLPAVSPRREGP
jgi:hypothetical protein